VYFLGLGAIMFFAAGAVAGFTLRSFSISAYVLLTGFLSLVYGLRPRRPLGWTVLVLYLPAAFFLAGSTKSRLGHLGHVETALHGTDPAAVKDAELQLQLRRQVSAPNEVTRTLVRELRSSTDDATRLKAVRLLGITTVYDDDALRLLSTLYVETRDDPARADLNGAVRWAIVEVNPVVGRWGEGILPYATDAAYRAYVDASDETARDFLSRIDRAVGAFSQDYPQLARWHDARSGLGSGYEAGNGKSLRARTLRYSHHALGELPHPIDFGTTACYIEIHAHLPGAGLGPRPSIPPTLSGLEIGGYRVQATVVTENPRARELEERIRQVILSAAAGASAHWESVKPSL
jgi:hypothetical protein